MCWIWFIYRCRGKTTCQQTSQEPRLHSVLVERETVFESGDLCFDGSGGSQRATGQTGGVQDVRSPLECFWLCRGSGSWRCLLWTGWWFSVLCWRPSEELSFLLQSNRCITLRCRTPWHTWWRSSRRPPAAFLPDCFSWALRECSHCCAFLTTTVVLAEVCRDVGSQEFEEEKPFHTVPSDRVGMGLHCASWSEWWVPCSCFCDAHCQVVYWTPPCHFVDFTSVGRLIFS